MEALTLTRKEMAGLLCALDGRSDARPLQVLQSVWSRTHQRELSHGSFLPAFLSTSLPPVIEKLIKGNELKGLSLHDIAALGSMIEYTSMSLSSIQNWVKRDFKQYFVRPKVGKKYSLNQAAMLLIIDDLKSNLDFESIRKLFDIVFHDPDDDRDDLLSPIDLYDSYTTMFEELDAKRDAAFDDAEQTKEVNGLDRLNEQMILQFAEHYADQLPDLTEKQRLSIRNILLVAVISIQSSYYLSLSRRYCNATLFLPNKYDPE